MSLIDQYAEDIQRLCEQHNVRRLYAFGSMLTDHFQQDSDVDLIVDFEPLDVRPYADNYFNFKFALEDTLHRQVDLLEGKTIRNPYFIENKKSSREELRNHRRSNEPHSQQRQLNYFFPTPGKSLTRNRIIHGYDTVSDEVLWGIINDHLPILKQEVEKLLDE